MAKADPLGLFPEEEDPLNLFTSPAVNEEDLSPYERENLDPELVRAMGGEVDPRGFANLGIDIGLAIPAGIRGAGQALATGSIEEGVMGIESSMEQLREAIPRFRGEGAKKTEKEAGELLEAGVRAVGTGAEALKTKYNLPSLIEHATKGTTPEQFQQQYAPGGDPLARGIGEVATDLAPIPAIGKGARIARRPAPRAAEAGVGAADEAMVAKAQQIATETGRPVMEVLDELVTGKPKVNDPLDLFPETLGKDVTLPDVPPPLAGGRGGGIMDPEAVMRLEAEMQGDRQGSLFAPEQARQEILMGEGATPSLRSKERGPDIAELPTERVPGRAAPKLTEQELYGPREKVIEPATGMEFKQPHAADFYHKDMPFDAKLLAITKSGHANTSRMALEHIRDSKEVPEFLSYLADRLLQDKDFNPKMVAVERILTSDVPEIAVKEGWEIGGLSSFSRVEGAEIKLSEKGGYAGNAGTVLHEAMHAKTAAFMHAVERGFPLPRNIRESVEAINHLYEYTKKHASPEFLQTHGMADSREFIAEAFTNSEFQLALKDMRYKPRPGEGFIKTVLTAWDAFVHSVARLLGLDPKRIDMLSATINEGARLMRAIEGNRALAKLAYSNEGIKQAALFRNPLQGVPANKAPKVQHQDKKTFFDDLKKAGKNSEFINRFGKALYKNYTDEWNKAYGYPKPQVGYDNRPHEEFRTDLYNPDKQMRVDDIKHSWGPGYTESKRHPILSRIYDITSQIENATNNIFDTLYRKRSIESGKGISAMRHSKLKEHPDSVAAIATKFTDAEVKNFSEVVGDYIKRGKIEELLAAPEKVLPLNEARMVKALKELGDEGLKRTNEIRVKQGLEPIKGRSDWFVSHVRHGKYHIYSLGKDGRSTYRKGFKTAAEANAVAAALRAKGHNNIRIATAANDPRRTVLPPEAFHEAKKMVETQAQRDLLDAAIDEAVLRMGTKKFGKARRGEAEGLPLAAEEITALGHKQTFENFMFGVRSYSNSVARYVGANKDGHAGRAYDMFKDSSMEMDYPNAMNAARVRWDTYTGVDKTLNDLSQVAGKLNQAFLQTNVVALNPVFYFANLIQFGFAPARMLLENARTLGGKGSVPEAILKGISKIYFIRDPEVKAVIREAVNNGSLEARLAEALDWDIAEGSKLGNAVRAVSMQKAATLSDSFSRMATYMMFYELAKSAGHTGKKAHSFAAKESQGVMIQYNRVQRMPVFNQFGVMGDLASPVTSFVSNLGFNVAQYMKAATVGDKVAGRLIGPILAYLTFQVATSGVRGLPGYEQMDEAIGWLNQWYVEKFGGEWLGTPSEFMNAAGANDYVQYGVPTAATDINMTGTLGFGHVLPSVITQAGEVGKMFPGVDFGGKMVESLWLGALSSTGQSTLTESERQRIASQVMPGFLKEWVRQGLSQEGSDLSKGRAVGADKDLIYQRDPVENMKALLSGRTPLQEAKIKHAVKLFKMKEASVGLAKKQSVQLLADAVQRDKDIPRYVENVISNYPELVESVMDSVIKELESRNVPFYERKLIEAVQESSLSGIRKQQTLQQLFQGE